MSLHLKGLREKHSPELSTQIFGEGEGASKAEPAQASPISTFSWHGLGAVRSKLRAPSPARSWLEKHHRPDSFGVPGVRVLQERSCSGKEGGQKCWCAGLGGTALLTNPSSLNRVIADTLFFSLFNSLATNCSAVGSTWVFFCIAFEGNLCI